MRLLRMHILILFPLIIAAGCQGKGPGTYTNPIIPGGFPDPSICREGDTYYLVNSSFIWYPGVPVHRSKDLVNWELISYALNTPEHLDINDDTGVHGGVWAPTIRYHNGLFYLTVTQKRCGTSILTTATDPAGTWSAPVTLHSENGIDGSLFFDDDRAWYCWSEDHLILLREFDIREQVLTGDTILLLNEQMFGDDYNNIEGPHIYKLETNEYMLLIASGGTGSNNHNVSVFKSTSPEGPYTPCPDNPVLTHRGTASPFNNIGHADIVQTQKGEWYAVTLGVRPLDGLTIMDRETFLVKFVWRNGWPVFNPDSGGIIVPEDIRPDLPWTPVSQLPDTDHFDSHEPALVYNFYHTPHKQWWSLTDNPGYLRIYNQEARTTDQTNTPVIARRITQFDFDASTSVSFDPRDGETAGLIAMMNQRGQMRLELFATGDQRFIRLVTYMEGPRTPLKKYTSDSIKVKDGPVVMRIEARGLEYRFFAGSPDGNISQIGEAVSGEVISKQRIGSYSGAYVGVFASSNGKESHNFADFDFFRYSAKRPMQNFRHPGAEEVQRFGKDGKEITK
jgi:xylan 1,4-beta-xylosidase